MHPDMCVTPPNGPLRRKRGQQLLCNQLHATDPSMHAAAAQSTSQEDRTPHRVQALCAQVSQVLHAAACIGGCMQHEPHGVMQACVATAHAWHSCSSCRTMLALCRPSCRANTMSCVTCSNTCQADLPSVRVYSGLCWSQELLWNLLSILWSVHWQPYSERSLYKHGQGPFSRKILYPCLHAWSTSLNLAWYPLRVMAYLINILRSHGDQQGICLA